MIKRFGWFFLVNILIIVTISIVTSMLGVNRYLTETGINYTALMLFCLVWGMGGAFISLALSRIAAKWMMGVQLVDPNSSGEGGWVARKVHELARAANLPAMPQVGIYDSPDINAFATGPTRSRSLVAVSSGLLRSMNQDQVEAVLAHEVAHIQNGDMVTMTLLQGVMNAIVMFLARVVAFFVGQAVKDDNARYWVQFAVIIVLEIALSLLGMIAVSYFSRHREFRADAGAARLAGRQKMISALEVLQRAFGRIDTHEPESIAAFKISSKGRGLGALFSTHPPLEERIARLQQMA